MLRIFFCFIVLTLTGSLHAAAGHAGADVNQMLVCENSLQKLAWDLEFFRHAEQSIDMSVCYTGGKILREILSTFDKRLQEVPELQIRFLLSPLLLEEDNRNQLAQLVERFPSRFHVVYTANLVNIFPNLSAIDSHAKMVIVDGHYFSIGGTNLDDNLCSDGTFTPERNRKGGLIDDNLPSGTRDADIVGMGPIAKEMRKVFYNFFAIWKYLGETGQFISDPAYFQDHNEFWELDPNRIPYIEKFATCERLITPGQVKFIHSGTMHRPNHITQEYEKLIRNARQEIYIGNLYFCPVDPILKSLLDAVNQKLSITLITNGVSDIAPQYTELFCWANRIHYVPILYGRDFHFWEASLASRCELRSTKIYEYNVKDILYHKKVMIVDRRYMVIGSYNLGVRSDLGDYEVVLVIDSPELAETELKIMDREIANYSIEIKPEQARQWYFDPITAYIGGTQRQFHGFF